MKRFWRLVISVISYGSSQVLQSARVIGGDTGQSASGVFFVKRTFCLISPSSKLKMFTGSVCVLLTGVSLKLIKIKIKLIYATTSSCEKKKTKWRVKGKWRRLILPFLMIRVDFLWSELIRLAVRVDPVRLLCRKYHWNGAAELHISVDLLCGITVAAELHISVDLLCGITTAELHNSVDLLCGTTAA